MGRKVLWAIPAVLNAGMAAAWAGEAEWSKAVDALIIAAFCALIAAGILRWGHE